MKRRQITAIIAALAMVGSTALLTGCAGKSYYYKVNDAGQLEYVGEIVSHYEDSTAESSTESKSEETPTSTEEEDSEEPSQQTEESSQPADEPSASTTDDDTLGTITVELPADWDAQDVTFIISDSNSKTAKPTVSKDGNSFSAVVSKNADDGEAFVDPKFNINFKKGDSGSVKSTEDTPITGTKTYVASQDGKKYILTEK